MIENWEQYKDLEFYPDRVCKCGCGGRIRVQKHHKRYGIPEYIHGHHRRGTNGWNQGLTKETSKSIARTAEKNTGKPAWNKNLTKETDPRVAKYAKSGTGVSRGPAWNKDLTKDLAPQLAHTEKAKKKIGDASRNRKYSDECRKNQSILTKRLWQDPVYRENHLQGIREAWKVDRDRKVRAIVKAAGLRPNKSERRLNKFLQEIAPKEYQINVKAEVMILGGKVPDFVNVNGQKKIIEFFGDYWHGKEFTGRTKEEEEQQRIDCFAQVGWETLIIWEHELKNLDFVKQKILEFNRKV